MTDLVFVHVRRPVRCTTRLLHSVHAIPYGEQLSLQVVAMTTSLIVCSFMAWGDKSIMTLRSSICGWMVRRRKTNFTISVIRSDRPKNRLFFTVCSAASGDTHSSVHDGYSCIGIDARSNEKPYATMRHAAAPDGFYRLDHARVSAQLPELPRKESNYRRYVDRKFVIEH